MYIATTFKYCKVRRAITMGSNKVKSNIAFVMVILIKHQKSLYFGSPNIIFGEHNLNMNLTLMTK